MRQSTLRNTSRRGDSTHNGWSQRNTEKAKNRC
jgi:hypothetical protein